MDVTLAVYNVLGQRVRVLVSGLAQAGRHGVVWDGRDASGKTVASGVYVISFQTEDGGVCCKISLVR